jgi:hypothetical protein
MGCQGMHAWTLGIIGPYNGPHSYRPSMQRKEPMAKRSATTPLINTGITLVKMIFPLFQIT